MYSSGLPYSRENQWRQRKKGAVKYLPKKQKRHEEFETPALAGQFYCRKDLIPKRKAVNYLPKLHGKCCV